MTTKQEILLKLSDAVLKFDEEEARNAANEVLENNLDISEAILKGLSDGMTRAGELFKQQEYFVPEVLLCADAMEEGLKILRPHISKNAVSKSKGKIILGTVEGDIHAIGKNLVELMLSASGFKVHDLGEDVPVARTTMMAIKQAIPMLKNCDPNLSIMVGGAPLTKEIADSFGADGYAIDAVAAVTEAERIMSLRSM